MVGLGHCLGFVVQIGKGIACPPDLLAAAKFESDRMLELGERLGPQPVEPSLGVGPDVDQARLPQDPQVPRDPRLVQAGQLDQLADRVLLASQEVEELSALEDDSDLVDDELPDPLDDFPPRLSFL